MNESGCMRRTAAPRCPLWGHDPIFVVQVAEAIGDGMAAFERAAQR